VAGVAPAPESWGDVWSVVKADIRRRLALEERRATLLNAILIANRPGVVCVVAYRITNFLHQSGRRLWARVIDDVQHLYTGVEIHAGAEIGPGFVYGDLPGGGISEHVTMGRNCTVLGCSTLTLNAGGIDLSKGRIILGDYCIVGVGVRVLGAVTLADGTQIKPNAVVLQSSTVVGGVLEGIPARRKSLAPIEQIARWNPLRSAFLSDPHSGDSKTADRSA
jgi:serine O-acetyltransferase